MNKARLSRIGGWALPLAGLRLLLFVLVIYYTPDSYAWYLQEYNILQVAHRLIVFVLGPLFMLFGLLGLWARYGKEVGWLGRNALLVGAIGDPLLAYAAAIFNWGVMGAVYLTLLALAFGQICLVIFGIAALKHKPLTQMNWLPLAAGIWFPVAYPFHFFILKRFFYVSIIGVLDPADVVDALIFAGMVVQAIGMAVLGLIVRKDTHVETD